MHRKTFFLLAMVILALVLVVAAVNASARAARWLPEDETVIWDLKNPQVVDTGQTVVLPPNPQEGFPGGVLTTGYILETKAKSKSGKLIPEGTFRLTLAAFKPNADMPGQAAGMWYVEGNWTIVDKNADKEALKSRHNPYTAAGKISAVLTFNPAEGQGNWSAKASVPMSLAANQWARGSDGTLTLGAGLEGDLFLVLKLWPEMQ